MTDRRRHTDQWPWRWLPLFGYGFLAVAIAATLGLMQKNADQQQEENRQARVTIVDTARDTVFVMCESENDLRETLSSILDRSAEASKDEASRTRLLVEAGRITQIDCIRRAEQITANQESDPVAK